MNVWPFMFAASKTSDYQFVVLPNIFDADTCDALRKRLEIDDTDPRKTKTATVPVKQAKTSVWCIYRSGPIVIDNAIQNDSAGRKLLFAYGLVAKETPAGSSLQALSNLIDVSQPSFQEALVSFLHTDREWVPVVKKAIEIPIDVPEAGPTTNRKLNVSLAVLLAALVICLAMCAVLYSRSNALQSSYNALESRNSALESQISELKSQIQKAQPETTSNPNGAPAATSPAPAETLAAPGGTPVSPTATSPAPAEPLATPAETSPAPTETLPAQAGTLPASKAHAQNKKKTANENSKKLKKSFDNIER
jgi:hypothetical protein